MWTLNEALRDMCLLLTRATKLAHGTGVPPSWWLIHPSPTSLAIASAASPPYCHGLSTNRCALSSGSVPVNPAVSSGLTGVRGPKSLDEHCCAYAGCAFGAAADPPVSATTATNAAPEIPAKN